MRLNGTPFGTPTRSPIARSPSRAPVSTSTFAVDLDLDLAAPVLETRPSLRTDRTRTARANDAASERRLITFRGCSRSPPPTDPRRATRPSPRAGFAVAGAPRPRSASRPRASARGSGRGSRSRPREPQRLGRDRLVRQLARLRGGGSREDPRPDRGGDAESGEDAPGLRAGHRGQKQLENKYKQAQATAMTGPTRRAGDEQRRRGARARGALAARLPGERRPDEGEPGGAEGGGGEAHREHAVPRDEEAEAKSKKDTSGPPRAPRPTRRCRTSSRASASSALSAFEKMEERS